MPAATGMTAPGMKAAALGAGNRAVGVVVGATVSGSGGEADAGGQCAQADGKERRDKDEAESGHVSGIGPKVRGHEPVCGAWTGFCRISEGQNAPRISRKSQREGAGPLPTTPRWCRVA